MKLGFVSAVLPELPPDRVLTFARAGGFACIEAMCWPAGKAERKYAGVTHMDVAALTQTGADDINALCAGPGSDDFKIRPCQLSKRAGADWVKTSSGYGFVKLPDGNYHYKGATEHDLALMRASVSARVQVKAAGGVRDLDGLIRVRDRGGSHCGATATAAMMNEYRRREAAEKAGGTEGGSSAKPGRGGY